MASKKNQKRQSQKIRFLNVKLEKETDPLNQFKDSIIDAANIWIYVLDAEANILVWNRVAETICGYTKEEAIGNKKIWQQLYPDKKYREKIFAKISKIVKEGKTEENFETIIRCKNGTRKTISWNFRDLDGNTIGSMAIGRDITELKEKEHFINIHKNLASALSDTSDFEKALKICMDAVLKESDMDCGGFYLLDKNTGDFNLKYSRGLSRGFIDLIKLIKRNSGQASLIMRGDSVHKFYPELGFNMDPIRKKEGLKAISILPIKYNGKVIACMNIASHKVDYLDNHNRSILEMIANEAGATIVRSRDRKIIEASEEKYRTLVEALPTRIWSKDKNSVFTSCNKALADDLEINKEDIAGKTDYDFFSKEDADNYVKGDRKVLQSGMTLDTEESLTRHGQILFLHTIKAPLRDEKGNISGTLGMFWDITDKKKAEKNLKHLSFHDKLTGIYNRAYFEEELVRIDSGRQLPISLIMGDVNGLKLVNDAFGHSQGDKLLITTAAVLEKSCRKDDIVARYGGDEFAIILPKTSSELCAKVLKRIKNAINKTKDQKIPLSVSFGAATKGRKSVKIDKILGKAEDNMYTRKLLEAKSISSSIISSLTESLWQKDIETRKHADRLKSLALKMGEKLQLPESMLSNLSLLATLHDIGKLAISPKLLRQKGKLTKKQWAIVKRHPEIGSRIAQASPMLLPIANLILSHHEWWNGNGYPRSIKKRRIPVESRIISIIDAYDTMIAGRPYQKKMTKEKALKELKRCSGTQFHPRLVNVFIDMMK